MLKTFRGLALGLVVLVGSAYVTPTYASSTSVIITSVQPGAPSRAHEEYILLYNTTPSAVDMTDWCLTNKSDKEFACFTVDGPEKAFIIGPHSYALVVSEYKSTVMLDSTQYSSVYVGNSLTTSSITASSDTISLLDHTSEVVDSVSWSKAITSQNVYNRILLPDIEPDAYLDAGNDSWYSSPAMPAPNLSAGIKTIPGRYDVCANIRGHQEHPPDGFVSSDGVCTEGIAPPATTDATVMLSEVFANPVGPDTGNEYIELYNAGASAQLLSDYLLLIGKNLEKVIKLPEVYVEPGQYIVIKNDAHNFTLLNTNNRVALFYGGEIVDLTSYSSPKDGVSWSLIGSTWQYTNQPTPGSVNIPNDLNLATSSKAKKSGLKPCASNQYRHPETNRCRLINPSGSSSTKKPCASNQYRNPETGRCKLISTASGPKPCKDNQERNAETNRCRNIKKMSNVDYGVLGATTEANQEEVLHMWVLGAVAVAGVLAYAVWEWRRDIALLWRELKIKFAREHK